MTIAFKSIRTTPRAGETQDYAPRILALFRDGRPRTSEESGERIGIKPQAAASFLSKLTEMGELRVGKPAKGIQIWEPVAAKWDKDAPAPVPGKPKGGKRA